MKLPTNVKNRTGTELLTLVSPRAQFWSSPKNSASTSCLAFRISSGMLTTYVLIKSRISIIHVIHPKSNKKHQEWMLVFYFRREGKWKGWISLSAHHREDGGRKIRDDLKNKIMAINKESTDKIWKGEKTNKKTKMGIRMKL